MEHHPNKSASREQRSTDILVHRVISGKVLLAWAPSPPGVFFFSCMSRCTVDGLSQLHNTHTDWKQEAAEGPLEATAWDGNSDRLSAHFFLRLWKSMRSPYGLQPSRPIITGLQHAEFQFHSTGKQFCSHAEMKTCFVCNFSVQCFVHILIKYKFYSPLIVPLIWLFQMAFAKKWQSVSMKVCVYANIFTVQQQDTVYILK